MSASIADFKRLGCEALVSICSVQVTDGLAGALFDAIANVSNAKDTDPDVREDIAEVVIFLLCAGVGAGAFDSLQSALDYVALTAEFRQHAQDRWPA